MNSPLLQVDVHVVVAPTTKRNGKSVIVANSVSHGENSETSVNGGDGDREYPMAGLPFDIPLMNACAENQLIGGFIVPKCYASLYTRIWKKYGHLATTEVWRGFPQTLLTTVAGLLPVVDEMNRTRLQDVKNEQLHKWDDMISNCEVLQFNVSWLRRRLEVIKVDRAAIIANMISTRSAIIEEEKSLALESARIEKAFQDLRTRNENFQRMLESAGYNKDYPLLEDFL